MIKDRISFVCRSRVSTGAEVKDLDPHPQKKGLSSDSPLGANDGD